jgi:hypothetical protein
LIWTSLVVTLFDVLLATVLPLPFPSTQVMFVTFVASVLVPGSFAREVNETVMAESGVFPNAGTS